MFHRRIKGGTTQGTRTRVWFKLRDATDGITPETGEAGGQPQISIDGASGFTNTGIGTLVHVGNGSYYAELTSSTCGTGNIGKLVVVRYKSANTVEAPDAYVEIVKHDPDDNDVTVKTGFSLANGSIVTATIADGALTAAKAAAGFFDAAWSVSTRALTDKAGFKLASDGTDLCKTGYKLAGDGLDQVMIAGKTLPAAVRIIGAGALGKLANAGSGNESFYDFAGTLAAVVTADASGNRTQVVYS